MITYYDKTSIKRVKELHLLIIPSWYPRANKKLNGIFFKDQAEVLANHGLNVGVISPDLCSPTHNINEAFRRVIEKSAISEHQINNIETIHYDGVSLFPKIPFLNYFLWRRAGLKLFKQYIEKNGVPDIIHAHCSLYGGLIASVINKKYKIPYLITEHSSDYMRDLLPWWKLSLVKAGLKRCSKFICVSSALQKSITSIFKVLPNTEIIPNMISDNTFTDQELIKDSNSFSFLCIGRLEPNKNQMLLLEAFNSIHQSYPNANLILIGDGVQKNQIQTFVRDNKLEKKVTLLGNLPHNKVMEQIKDAHVVVSPSLFETFGITLIEALSQGIPIIATDCGGPADIVSDRNGILLQLPTIENLSHAMIRIIENYMKYNQINIVRNAFEHFSSSVICSKLIKAYNDIINQELSK